MRLLHHLLPLIRVFIPPLKQVPASVYAQLVTQWQHPHEELQRLRCVLQKGEAEGHPATLIRIVDPEELGRQGLKIHSYADLNDHREVIWYEGWYTTGPRLHVDRVNAPKRKASE
jgi:hypothetical protein